MHAPISVHATHSFEPAASPPPKWPTEVPTMLPPGDGTRGWHHWRCGVLRSALRSWAAVSRGAVAYMLAKAAEHFGAAVHARRRRLDRRGWGGDGAGRMPAAMVQRERVRRPRRYVLDAASAEAAAAVRSCRLRLHAENRRYEMQSDYWAPVVLCRQMSCPCGVCSSVAETTETRLVFSERSGEKGVEEPL